MARQCRRHAVLEAKDACALMRGSGYLREYAPRYEAR